jgi:hypothetical protein
MSYGEDYSGGGASLPVDDATALVKGSVDPTKLVRIEADVLATATTRVITMPDQDVDLTPDTGAFSAAAHKDRHSPQDGADALDCAAPAEIASVQGASEGTADTFARSDHAHAINHGLTDNHIVTIDEAGGATPGEYCRFAAGGIQGRTAAEVAGDVEANIKLDDLAAPDDNTDLDASTSAHGLLRKLDDDATHFLDGDGAWSGLSATNVPAKFRTRTDRLEIKDPKATDAFEIGSLLHDDITMVQVRAYAGSGSVTFQIERRTTANPLASGTNVLSASLTPNSGEASTTSFAASGAVAAEQILYFVASATSGDPAHLFVWIEYTID